MKNVYLLPTDKPSRILQSLKVIELLDKEWLSPIGNVNKNIYITYDEEIREGDWCLYNKNHNYNDPNWEMFKCSKIESEEMHPISNGKLLLWMNKIILTTDQDLIEDGVQSIDDEFLEWFVKNPSCEEVETKLIWHESKYNTNIGHTTYEIITFRKESKEDCFLLSKCICKEPGFDVMKGLCKVCGNSIIHLGERISTADKIKQETLEEAFEIFKQQYPILNKYDLHHLLQVARFGVKWQQERSYSKEDLLTAYRWGTQVNQGTQGHFQEILKQLKAKNHE